MIVRSCMKKILGFIVLLLMAMCVMGCIDVSPSISKPGTAAKAPPKYSVGDIAGQEQGDDSGSLILSYSPDSDTYTTQIVYFQPDYKNGQWVYYEWSPQSYRREFEESYDPYLLGHVDPNSVENYFSQYQ
jgi:hypothetical protein